MRCIRLPVGFLCAALAVGVAAAAQGADEELAALEALPKNVDRPWIGPAYWANPLQDWRMRDGRIECISPARGRTAHLLTRRLADRKAAFEIRVRVGTLDGKPLKSAVGAAGLTLGVRSELGDYRSSLIHGRRGYEVGIGTYGTILDSADLPRNGPLLSIDGNAVELRVKAEPTGDTYTVTLELVDPATGKSLAGKRHTKVAPSRLIGNIALTSNFGSPGRPPRRKRGAKGAPAPKRSTARFWFSDLVVTGEKIDVSAKRAFGPILFALHTLSRGVMKMTAQMPPVGLSEAQTVRLQIAQNGAWREIAQANIDKLSRTATFRVEDWDDTRDTPYRIAYALTVPGGARDFFYTGTVRKDPVDKGTIVVAGFTGNTDPAFPNAKVAENVAKMNPDVLAFTGDQLYEGVAGFGIKRLPVDVAVLDYLRKWYLFGWAFREIMRDRPALCLPDDHDVYQGNIWGNGGNPITLKRHAAGGYVMHPAWVNAIQRMQTAHHPDPFDPEPIKQGITVYFGDMVYGRVSFAIFEDRKFKSGPQGNIPPTGGRPDHIRNPKFDPKTVDRPGLKLLGDRQLRFLRHWAADWRGADMKIAVSQTIFANVANYHGGGQAFLVADLDANGWPQSGRNLALDALRRGFAVHLAGDQHLPSIVQHGIDEHRDAIWSFCVPSIAAGYPRSWRPDREGRPVRNRLPGAPPNTGDYLDGLHNKITVWAVGNPEKKNRRPVLERLHDKASGFGIVRLNKRDRTITLECYRLLIDPDDPKPGDQFPGWPRTVHMLDNYARAAIAHLPTLRVAGMTDPVVQVVDESNGETVYTLRIPGSSFRPKVFKEGTYTVRIGEPGTPREKTLTGLRAVKDNPKTLDVRF